MVRDGLYYEKCFLGGKKGLKSERWGPLSGGRRQVGRSWYPSLPGLCCHLAVIPGCWGQQPLPPGAVSDPGSLHLTPISPHFPPPSRAAGHRRLRCGSPLNFENDGERGDTAGTCREDSHGEGHAESCPHPPWPLGPRAGSRASSKKPHRSRPPAAPRATQPMQEGFFNQLRFHIPLKKPGGHVSP